MSVPTTHLVLFIASIAVAAGVAGAFTAESSRMSATIEDVGIDVTAEVDADIEILTDAGTTMYDSSSDNLTVHVQNKGEATLPHAVDQVDVFLDGVYQPSANLTITVEDASEWDPDEVIRIDIDAPNLANADHRIKVVVDGDEDTIIFNPQSGCGAATRNVLVYQDPGDDDLHFIDRSGVITDLNAVGGGHEIMAFGPAADFDCDGLLEAPYVRGQIDEEDSEWEQLRIVDRNGEIQTLYTWPGGGANVGENWEGRLGSGDLDGDGIPEVVFPDPDDSEDLYRVEVGGNPSQINTGHDSWAVGGLGDFNGDGDLDLVYLEASSNEVMYLENQTETNTGVPAESQNSIGGPADFDGDGVARVPIKHDDLLQQIALVDFNGNTETLNLETTDSIGSIATFDWNDDGTPDVVWVDNGDSDRLYYTELDGTTTRIQDDSGNPVEATDLGVA